MKKRNLLLLAAITFGMGNLWALDKVDEVYQITNGQDLVDFANLVNGDAANSGAAAVLTTDIDLSGVEFPTIGRDGSRYWGTFDGQGHRILNMKIEGSTKELGLFNVVSSATIKNLILDSSCVINSGDCTAALIGCCNGSGVLTIENVGIECDVKGTGPNAAAFVGCNYSNGNLETQIRNCYNTGNITGGRESAVFSGWFGNNGNTRVTNSWNTGKVNGADGNNSLGRGIGSGQFVNTYDLNSNNGRIAETILAGYEDSWMTSGQLAYILNGLQSETVAWYQKLGAEGDAHPYPFGTYVVYANGDVKCDGVTPKEGSSITYSNTEGAGNRDPHNFNDYGFCTECDQIQLDFVAAVDGVYPLATDKQLNWFAEYVERVEQNVNAKLTADIDFTAFNEMIGQSQGKAFKGTFDGQGHKITINLTDKYSRTGLFAYINAATIRNLYIDGTITMSSHNCAGGVGGRSDGDGTLIENVVSAVTINDAQSGDGTIGGLFANMENNNVIVRNCAFIGTVNAPDRDGNGGLVGWAGSGKNITFENCLVAPAAISWKGGATIARNTPTISNCFASDVVPSNGFSYQNGATVKVVTDLTTGEVAFELNGLQSDDVNWYQVIGTDDKPLPLFKEGGVVYANGSLYCDGTAKPGIAYENEKKESVRDEHNFGEWGFCVNEHDGIVCDEIQPDFVTPTDGVYALGTAKQLNWFAVYTQRVDATVNAKLTADIDMAEVGNYPGIGIEGKNYTGTFDGQRHILSNVKMEFAREGVGFINRAANGAHLKNVTLASNSSFKGSKAVAGLIGGLYGGGDVYIDNCGNEASVESTGQNAGGVIGVCFNGTIAHLTNVYNVGTIKGNDANESGSLSGWMTNAVLVNCYSVAGYPTAEDTHGFVEGKQFGRGDGIKLTNCYDYGTGDWGTNNGTWGVFTKISDPDDELEMGKAFAGLFDGEGGNVWRMEFNGWAHPVLYDTDIVLKENFPNRIVAAENADVTFYRTTVADAWNTFAAPVALTAEQVEEVFGTGAKVAALKEIAGEVATFVTVTATEAGKAYLVMPTAAKTTFDVKADLSDAAPADAVFQGVYTPTELTANDLFVATGNKLQAAKSGSLKAFRAYFKDAAASGAKFFTVDGEANGIIGLNGEVMTAKEVYNLNGQRVNAAQKGVYIVNGKKVVM